MSSAKAFKGRQWARSAFKAAHDLCSSHKDLLRKTKLCACFGCARTFLYVDIREWIQDQGGPTALCPHCELDMVIPVLRTKPQYGTTDFLAQMCGRYIFG